jgi:hypothetical protein
MWWHCGKDVGWVVAVRQTRLVNQSPQPDQFISGGSVQLRRGPQDSSYESGKLGCVPKCAAVGEVVCFLYGETEPFGLRLTGNGSHTLIVACNVDGLIDGEVMQMKETEACELALE